MRVERHATYWRCDAQFELEGPHCASAFELLDVHVPLAGVRPYSCLGNTIVFYDTSDREVARCRHLDLAVGTHLVFLGNRWWQVQNGSVVQHNGRWALKWHLCGNTRTAVQANAGAEADKRAHLAASN
jgi:hypothetical protein